MSSVLITGHRYRVKPEEADKYGPFNKTFLAEGDSWMDASAWNQGSLPEFLVNRFNEDDKTNLIVKISTSGHTLTRIVDMMNGDLVWWLDQQRYDGLLFSAGGNDFIDAAREAPAGQGLLRDMKGQPLPENGFDCVRPDALMQLKAYLNTNFAAIYQTVRSSGKNADTPIFLNCYDTPRARNAPAIPGFSGPWLYEAYVKNSIDHSLWDDLTDGIFAALRETIEGWKADPVTGVLRTAIHTVPTVGLLDKSAPGSTGDDADWVNEIHPNECGWNKQVAAWLPLLPS
ncbi:hypothetical protein RQP53_15300 [Paucibacter sp. APW11]|uniref:SGNH hydrolase-type esterase domain-containing protein n=1 Tax=Roseateles aquae TaxID=3077235 RepID=A0ABU3PDK2_9BURK|nr:hypothetical protein [Paucibacter sp. APW11]MDT9000640.1 hypothetical protein [Paucibacter sp. APW11]